MITTVLFLCVYGLYCARTASKGKPLPWEIANIVALVAAGLVVVLKQDLYFLVGALTAVGFVAYQALSVKLNVLTGWKTYAKIVVENLLFWPVPAFEAAYTWLASKF
jgi:hypothetical protein